jgi:hypothetical protein
MNNTAHGWNLHSLIGHCLFVGFVEEVTPIHTKSDGKAPSNSLKTGGKASSISKGMWVMWHNFMILRFFKRYSKYWGHLSESLSLYSYCIFFIHMLYSQCYNIIFSPFQGAASYGKTYSAGKGGKASMSNAVPTKSNTELKFELGQFREILKMLPILC